MALNKIGLKNSIKGTLDRLFNNQTLTPEQASTRLAGELADHIENYIKSGVVNTVVTTTGGNGTGVGNIT